MTSTSLDRCRACHYGNSIAFTTNDGAATWRPLTLRSDVSEIVDIDAASPTHIAVVYRTAAAARVNRLAYTTNGGSKWHYIDTVVANNEPRLVLFANTTVGVFPGDAQSSAWGYEIQFVDESTLIVPSSAVSGGVTYPMITIINPRASLGVGDAHDDRSVAIDVADLASGVFLLRIEAPGLSLTRSIFISR